MIFTLQKCLNGMCTYIGFSSTEVISIFTQSAICICCIHCTSLTLYINWMNENDSALFFFNWKLNGKTCKDSEGIYGT